MVCFGAFIYQNTAQTMKKQLGNKCLGIASVVAVLLEDDIEGYINFCKHLNMQSDYYKKIYTKLRRIRQENDDNIAYLYVEKRVSETEIMYILDSESMDDEFFSPAGYVDEITDSEREAYRLQAPYIDDEFVTNQYGSLLTCYVPLRNPSTGEFLGLVGVDVSINQYNDVMSNQFLIIVISIALLIILLALSLLLSSSRVEKLLSRDNLTGAYNKTYFLRSLRQLLKYSKQRGGKFSVFMADLDHFKQINDTYGHIFGDIVLKTVSDTISKQLRKMDCLARFGGEEFAAYLPDADIVIAERVAERIRQAVESTTIYNKELDIDIKITISLGVTQFEPHLTVQEILIIADKELYNAKRTRNAISINKNE